MSKKRRSKVINMNLDIESMLSDLYQNMKKGVPVYSLLDDVNDIFKAVVDVSQVLLGGPLLKDMK